MKKEMKQCLNTIIAIALLILLIVVFSKVGVEPCRIDTAKIISHEQFLIVEYQIPDWLTGHTKECEIQKYISEHYHDIKADSKSVRKEFPNTALLPFHFSVNLDREIIEPYESIIIAKYEYTGGAHGNIEYEYYTLKNDREISLEKYLMDIGRTPTGFLMAVNKRLRKDGYETIEGFAGIPWYIRRNHDGTMGITVIFPPYTVASYAEGTIDYSF